VADASMREKERLAAGNDREAELSVRRDRCRAGQCCFHSPAAGGSPTIPKLPSLWYENEAGERWLVPLDGPGEPPTPPPGFIYQHSRFASQLTHSILRITQAAEVEGCEHPEEQIRPTGGWIEGIRGRRCLACQGTQTGPTDQDWPEEWDAHGSTRVMDGNMGWATDIVTEMVKHGTDVRDAILFAAIACERCANVAAWDLGLADGYPDDSEAAAKAGTSCELCEPEVYVEP